MLLNRITQANVGADLSCTSPIYRPSAAVTTIALVLPQIRFIVHIADYALSKFNMDYGILFSKRKFPMGEEERPCDDDNKHKPTNKTTNNQTHPKTTTTPQ